MKDLKFKHARERRVMLNKTFSLLLSFLVATTVTLKENNYCFENFSKQTARAEDSLAIPEPQEPNISIPGEPRDGWVTVSGSSCDNFEVLIDDSGSCTVNNYSLANFNSINQGLVFNSNSDIRRITIKANNQDDNITYQKPFQIKLSEVNLETTDTSSPISLEGNSNVLIKTEGKNILKSTRTNYPALGLKEKSSVTICGENKENDKLDVESKAQYCSAFGGGINSPCGNISIGGSVSVEVRHDAWCGAAIGGGFDNSPCGSINIGGNASVVSKMYGGNSSAIGGGDTDSFCSSINIGGNASVVANHTGAGSSAIGGGLKNSPCGDINISGNAAIMASHTSGYGSAIGGGHVYSPCNNINISSGFVATKGNNLQDDIGNGSDNSVVNSINITGGSVYCANSKISDKAQDSKGKKVYPCYVPKTLNSVDLKEKILTSGRYFTPYDAPTYNDKIEKMLADNNLTDLFPSNDLSACLYLPKDINNAMVKNSPSLTMRANVKEEAISLNDAKQQTDNWMSPLTLSSISNPFENWYNVNTPTINMKLTDHTDVKIEENDQIIMTEISDENGSLGYTFDPEQEASNARVSLTQTIGSQEIGNKVNDTLKVDTTPPTCKIKVEENVFENFTNTISFGLFFKDRVHVTIETSDNLSGVKTVEYCKTSDYKTEQEAKNLSYIMLGSPDNNGNISINFDPKTGAGANAFNETFFIYTKITDNAGNIFYMNSKSIIFYTDSEAETKRIYYTKKKDSDIEASVRLNGNTLKSVRNNTTKYNLTQSDVLFNKNIITFKKDYLETLKIGEYDLEISYDEAGVDTNFEPGTSKIILVVKEEIEKGNIEIITHEDPDANDKIYNDVVDYLDSNTKIKRDRIQKLKVFEVSLKDKNIENNGFFDLDLNDFHGLKLHVLVFSLKRHEFVGKYIENNPDHLRVNYNGEDEIYSLVGV